ncbi:hypothetical protein [Bacillus horti]|uniref:DUF4352 domain-containing protein n=1 Tax=Caldalkalibacillus horti TaxID=77523 RepID=A0ABT9VYT1_9BACI|nr:hypothetical protein [Bacillus horti]MDQ0165765.1 hypothetical protein [Bacillus horti]
MNKKVLVTVALVILLLAGSYTYLKVNPRLVATQTGYTTDRQIQVIGVGNKGLFGDIQIKEVLINNNVVPSNAKLQISNPLVGLTVTDRFFNEEQSTILFEDFHSVSLQTGTVPSDQIVKLREGTATEEDILYAISIVHDNPIEEVTIKYHHLGISHKKTLSLH